jgi:hypothetical protein
VKAPKEYKILASWKPLSMNRNWYAFSNKDQYTTFYGPIKASIRQNTSRFCVNPVPWEPTPFVKGENNNNNS